MRLTAGHHLGPYEVLAPLGAGGMGEVYRALDPRLGREVAIKVLPANRVANEGRRRRFVQEAKAASALNHPNIITIHEIESADGIDFIVMEYVPGQTLGDLIPKGGMPVREVLRLAVPIADALAAAHARGIVHRDLKPANVVVSREGVVKVLDFGQAKLAADDTQGGGDTLTADSGALPLSHPGAITGTAGYMSPEQATGGKVDSRSDVFSFGSVLYEMATGRRAFAGQNVSETLAAVVRDQPKAPREFRPEIPESLERIILRCLRKEPDRRFQHIDDAKVELREVEEEAKGQGAAPPVDSAATVGSRRRWMSLAGATVLILAAVLSATLWRKPPELRPPTVVQLTSERRAGGGCFSPDGTQIAYASAGEEEKNWDIWLKIVGETEARRLTNDEAVESDPAWSPDGTQIAFLRYQVGLGYFGTGTVHVMSPLGGATRQLSDLKARLRPCWSPDGRWLAVARARTGADAPGGLVLISVLTGEERPLTSPKAGAFDLSPSVSPDGRTLAYVSCEGADGNPTCDVYVMAVDSELRPGGTARAVTRERRPMFGGGLAWTRDGRTIVYATENQLRRVLADGSRLPQGIELAVRATNPATVGRGDRLAFVRATGESDIYRQPLGGSPTLVAGSTFPDKHPQWSPDRRRLAFGSSRAGGTNEIWVADADGSNLARLTRGPGRAQGSPSWSPDGQEIAFDSQDAGGQIDIWTIHVDGTGLRQVTRGPKNQVVPSFSRDGRFLYFASNRTGRFEIWRVPRGGGTEEQLTHDGGSVPLESYDGQTLYYMRNLGRGPLVARPTAGGEERTIIPCVVTFDFAVAARAVLHVACSASPDALSPHLTLWSWEAATGKDKSVAQLEADQIEGLSVSPDGRELLYGAYRATSDLMMIENFR